MASARLNPFVHRLIPAAAALSLTFGCGKDEGQLIDSSANAETNNGSTNNGSTNNDSTNNDSTNNGSTNNGSTNNGSTNNGSTNNGSTSNGSTNNGATNNVTPSEAFDGDGSPAAAEFDAFCQEFANCDAEGFASLYASVEDCSTSYFEFFNEEIAYYTAEYGDGCGLAYAAKVECDLSVYGCVNGEWLSTDDGTACEAETAMYEAACVFD